MSVGLHMPQAASDGHVADSQLAAEVTCPIVTLAAQMIRAVSRTASAAAHEAYTHHGACSVGERLSRRYVQRVKEGVF